MTFGSGSRALRLGDTVKAMSGGGAAPLMTVTEIGVIWHSCQFWAGHSFDTERFRVSDLVLVPDQSVAVGPRRLPTIVTTVWPQLVER